MGLELEAARQKLTQQVPTWQGQLDEVTGGGVELEVDPVGLPTGPNTLKRFINHAFDGLRAALTEVTSDARFAEYFKTRVSKILLRNDETAPVSRFDYEPGRRKLVIICSPELRHWVDGYGLQEFLRHEL